MTNETDNLQPQLLPKCPTGIRAFNAEGNVVRIACDRWTCPVCGRALSWRWAERVRYGIALWPGMAFLWTVTLPGSVRTPERGFQVLRGAWDNLRKSLQRQLPAFHYAAFVELHPHRSGIAHFHIVSLHKCPGRLKDVAHHAGFGYQAKEQEITGKEVAGYVAKYTSKQGAEMPKGFRRVRLSRTWPKLPAPLYDVPVLPAKPSESLQEYFLRIAARADITPPDAAARWEHPEYDL